MEPRLFSRGNHFLGDLFGHFPCELQWSRGFSAAEIDASMMARAWGRLASMEPRLFSRGNWNISTNWQSWSVPLQWSRGFSAAEIARKALLYSSVVSRFNGAAAFQPRKFR